MSIELKNIKLDKDKYIFGIDKKMILSFEIFSDIGENLKNLTIFYGYNFFGDTQKNNAFQNKIIEKEIFIEKNFGKKISYEIPINLFNLKKGEYYNMSIENYINIHIKNGILSKTILKKLKPNIKFNSNLYGINYLNINETVDFAKDIEIEYIEKLIIKNNIEKYEDIIKEIKLLDKEIEKLEEKLEDNINGKLSYLFKKKSELIDEKYELFEIKEIDKNTFVTLRQEEKKIIDDYGNNNDSDNYEDVDNYMIYINKLRKNKYNIYKTFLSNDYKKYNDLLEKYFYDIINEGNNDLNNIYNKINIGENIKNNNSDFQIIKKKFNGLFSGRFNKIFDDNYLFVDYIHKDIFDDLKKNIFINIFTKLVNSKIFNFIYKYSIILPIIGFIILIIDNINIKYIDIIKTNYFALIYFIIPISFILFCKIYEFLFQKIINNSIYSYKLLNSKNLQKNLEEKLINGQLNISDIFEKLELKINNPLIKYNFKIILQLNVGTYYTEGNNTNYQYANIYNIDLFNLIGKGSFNLNNVKLLKNNYKNLKNILVNSCKNPKTKISYSIVYDFDSNFLPDLNGEQELYLNF